MLKDLDKSNTLSRDLCRGDCCSDHCRVVFGNITPFKNAAKDSLSCPDNTNKFILFWGNITVFPCPMSIYKFIFILSRNPFDQSDIVLYIYDLIEIVK